MSCVQDSKLFFTCHSGNYLWSCSVLIRAGRPEGFFPCLHCGWRMTRGRVPGLRSSRCHYRCYCRCCSSATPPRNLSGQPDIISLKAGKLKPIFKFINDTQQKGPGPVANSDNIQCWEGAHKHAEGEATCFFLALRERPQT